MQDNESGRCIHTSCFSSSSPCWYSASPTGADTPWPTATTPPDQPTTPTPASLVLVLGLVGETSVSRVLETSVEELVIDMASALRDSFAPIATGLTKPTCTSWLTMFDPQVPRLLSHLFHLLVRRPLPMVTESRRHQDMIRVVTNVLKKYSIVERRDLISVPTYLQSILNLLLPIYKTTHWTLYLKIKNQ